MSTRYQCRTPRPRDGSVIGTGKRSIFAAISALILLLLVVGPVGAQTVMPSPVFTAWDSNGNPISGGKLCVYTAGTTTPATTFTDSALLVPNANPVIMNSAGRAVVYLSAGASYKFVLLQPGTDATCNTGATVWTQDTISAVPTASNNVDVLGTAGEALTAGQVVYLSDGSGSKQAGQWFKGDSTNAYSSIEPIVGMVPNAISATVAGTVRLIGSVTGIGPLVVGSTYYAGASGAVTVTAPANHRRIIGVADTTASLVLVPSPVGSPINVEVCQGRLTLTTAVPVTVADVTAATTLYFTPYNGNRCALYDGTAWSMRVFSEISVPVPATTSTMYDVYLYDNAGVPALELLAWTNTTTRATALTTLDGTLVKTGVTTRRYRGSFSTTTVSGQTEDSAANRLVYNHYNRVRRPLKLISAVASWTQVTSSTIRQANASTTNQVAVVVGVSEASVDLRLTVSGSNDTIARTNAASIGEDSTTVFSVNAGHGEWAQYVANAIATVTATLNVQPAIGYHLYQWLEGNDGVGTVTWLGVGTGSASRYKSGLNGSFEN